MELPAGGLLRNKIKILSMSDKNLIPASAATFLNLRHLPASLDVDQTAALLGRHPDHIAILVEGGLLHPLGNPPKNGPKTFAACVIQEHATDAKWLDKVAKYLTRYWKNRNAKGKPQPTEEPGPTPSDSALAA